ncbi:phospholipid diacylglycerol acyltransferase [Rickenella mellea]|uniref:Phospholipid diacylglycerol acyltransferase n=1 Tax=Rickenella mellea TaxID=50990 RepID=A0A4Y7PY29_9AGAM|nr:phospholipid diacylglycerol acyltransferase [Rickenella mellea]
MALKKRKTWAGSETVEHTTVEHTEDDDGTPMVVVHTKEELKRRWIASRRFLFPLGIFLGTLLGFVLVSPATSNIEFPAQLSMFLQQYDIQKFQIPGLDWTRIEAEWNNFKIPELWKLNNDGREYQVGEAMKERGLTAKHPVILVPGVISTGLESWSTSPEYRNFFREKVWGGFHMISQVTFNRERWMAGLMLDPETGLDPPDVKVRAAQGIDAASSFIQGYWIWSKVIENLAVVNYDPNNMFLAAYDWRLSFWNLEERDGYFSVLKSRIEEMRGRMGKKVVLVAHSMGSTVLKWVESPEHGRGGPSWVENHIEAFVSAAGTHLGVPKAMTAFLSGEMKDTVELHPAGAYVLERFFSRKERAKLFRSWAGSASMWIKGGSSIWGNFTHAPDDHANFTHTHGRFISFRDSSSTESDPGVRNMTVDEASTWILQHTPTTFQKMMAANFSFEIERDEAVLEKNNVVPSKWSNPLESRLPYAPSMKIYCAYGHGKETERSYWYARGEYEYDDSQADSPNAQCFNGTDCDTPRTPLDLPLARKNWIDAEVSDDTCQPRVRNGVQMGEGDGTVSLLSLGAMCVEGWKRKRWNPAGIKITTVELPHRPSPSIPRGGANTSDHVDVLGSTGLNELILKVATGVGDEIEDTFVSDIREYAARMHWD